MNLVYILLGGNLGDRISNLEKARMLICERVGNILSMSSVYETEPWGFDNAASFLNRIVVVETMSDYKNLFHILQEIETVLGRKRKTDIKYTSREIDLDILFFNLDVFEDHVINLQIPHPRLHLRKFVLVPLAELAPGLLHPVFNETVQSLLDRCQDNKWVRKYPLHLPE
ncbi:MAG: 2-amino-4-hydroxy-6-hydroxymethyldihydropteridine diphosphokinase [Bacteroidales bacterium]